MDHTKYDKKYDFLWIRAIRHIIRSKTSKIDDLSMKPV